MRKAEEEEAKHQHLGPIKRKKERKILLGHRKERTREVFQQKDGVVSSGYVQKGQRSRANPGALLRCNCPIAMASPELGSGVSLPIGTPQGPWETSSDRSRGSLCRG